MVARSKFRPLLETLMPILHKLSEGEVVSENGKALIATAASGTLGH
jgi:hypothetical protein